MLNELLDWLRDELSEYTDRYLSRSGTWSVPLISTPALVQAAVDSGWLERVTRDQIEEQAWLAVCWLEGRDR